MIKKELIAAVAEKADMPKTQVTRVIDELVDVVTEALKSGDDVQLAKIGTFKRKVRAGKEGRVDFGDGRVHEYKTDDHYYASFSVSKTLKDELVAVKVSSKDKVSK
ncbi:MAG: HU family DNA-binding protein [Bacteroidetes bacterium]|nr:HU family DNA-binding protein [Bacteroidota bacterium]